MKKYSILCLIFILTLAFCGNTENSSKIKNEKQSSANYKTYSIENPGNAKVIFVELGSTKCIPCKKMVPIMEAVEEEFGEQLKVIFYDVSEDKKPAKKFGIRLIPTQVFLDSTGTEFFRHEGFFPQEDIEKLLVQKGLTKIN